MTSGLETVSARSRTVFSMRSPWNVNASLRAAVGEPLRDRPRDRALVRDAEHESASFPRTWQATLIQRLRLLCGALRRPLILRRGCRAGRGRRRRSAAASIPPVRRPTTARATLPRVRAGTITIPAGHAARLTRVIVRLAPPPLAAWSAQADARLASRDAAAERPQPRARRPTSPARARQAAAVAELRAAIPQAQVQERFPIVLDGFTVELPAKQLPKLVAPARSSTQVYPSLAYTLTIDRGPAVIRADRSVERDRREGQGMKIGVVDTASTRRTRS